MWDNWNPFILCAGILALFTAGVFILGSWKVINHQHDGNEDGSHDGAVMMAMLMLPLEKVKVRVKVMANES